MISEIKSRIVRFEKRIASSKFGSALINIVNHSHLVSFAVPSIRLKEQKQKEEVFK